MKIAVDAMGGDYAPEEVVIGAINAVKEYKSSWAMKQKYARCCKTST